MLGDNELLTMSCLLSLDCGNWPKPNATDGFPSQFEFDWNFSSLFCNSCLRFCHNLAHTTIIQFSRRVIYKRLWRSIHMNSNDNKMKFSSRMTCDGNIINKWTLNVQYVHKQSVPASCTTYLRWWKLDRSKLSSHRNNLSEPHKCICSRGQTDNQQ